MARFISTNTHRYTFTRGLSVIHTVDTRKNKAEVLDFLESLESSESCAQLHNLCDLCCCLKSWTKCSHQHGGSEL